MMKLFTILIILAILNLGLVAPAVGKQSPPTTAAPPQVTQPPSPPPPSNSCVSALLEFITDNATEKCLPPKEIIRLGALLDPKVNQTTLVNAITTFATNVCPVSGKCSDAELRQISNKGKQLILKGCANDLNQTNPTAVIALSGITLYPPVIESLCFQDNNTKIFCFLEDAERIITLPKPNFTFINPALDKVIFCEPSNFCAPCFKRIVNTIFDFIFDPKDKAQEAIKALLALFGALKLPITLFQLSQLKTTVMIKCGFQFLDQPGL